MDEELVKNLQDKIDRLNKALDKRVEEIKLLKENNAEEIAELKTKLGAKNNNNALKSVLEEMLLINPNNQPVKHITLERWRDVVRQAIG